MVKPRKKKKTARQRFSSLVLFFLAGVVFWGREDLLWGLKGYLLDETDYLRIRSESDLPAQSGVRGQPAEISGIPDYKNVVRFPYDGKTLTCYRMVGFRNRLIVCSDRGLKRPEAIDEIIKERTIRGSLETLSKSPLEDRLRKDLNEPGAGIRVRDDAFLLSEGKAPLPSPVTLGVLIFCMIACCFFAYRLIKG